MTAPTTFDGMLGLYISTNTEAGKEVSPDTIIDFASGYCAAFSVLGLTLPKEVFENEIFMTALFS